MDTSLHALGVAVSDHAPPFAAPVCITFVEVLMQPRCASLRSGTVFRACKPTRHGSIPANTTIELAIVFCARSAVVLFSVMLRLCKAWRGDCGRVQVALSSASFSDDGVFFAYALSRFPALFRTHMQSPACLVASRASSEMMC